MSKTLNIALKFFSSFVTVAGATILFGLPTKAQVNPNPSIFNEYPYSRGDVAQTTPDNSQSGDTPYTTPTTEPNTTNETTPGTQGTQDITTPTTNPDLQNNSNTDDNTNNTDNTGNTDNTNNNNNGVRALW